MPSTPTSASPKLAANGPSTPPSRRKALSPPSTPSSPSHRRSPRPQQHRHHRRESSVSSLGAASSVLSSTSSLGEELLQRDRQWRRDNARATRRDVLLGLLALRLLNALCVRTFFQPDEYFQALEPAWRVAFGVRSGAWITWEWHNQLRPAIHPYLFAAAYWLAARLGALLGLTAPRRADLLVAAPQVVQAAVAAAGDFYTWRLGERVYGAGSLSSRACLALTVISPWQWFCATRTFSNSLETALTVAALEAWPWQWSLEPNSVRDRMPNAVREEPTQTTEEEIEEDTGSAVSKLRRCLLLAALACVLRPTNIIIWACVASFTLFRAAHSERLVSLWGTQSQVLLSTSWPMLQASRSELFTLLREAFLCGSAVLGISAVCDYTFYQQWVFPPLRFLHFNLAQSLAVFYGRNPWHYYILQGYPLLLTVFLPFAIAGLYSALTTSTSTYAASIRHQLAAVALILPAILSLISHKEVRFIYPLLPPLHILAGGPFASFFQPVLSRAPTASTLLHPRALLLLLTLLLATLIALLSTTAHQPAPLALMAYLRHEHEANHLTQPPPHAGLAPAPTAATPSAAGLTTVGILAPCHSTPWRAHLVHPGIRAWALTCEPPLHLPPGPRREAYVDEADAFYLDPPAWIRRHMGPPPRWHPPGRLWGAPGRSAASPAVLSAAADEGAAWDGRPGAHPWPEYLVFLEGLEGAMRAVGAREAGYRECWRGWNSWGHDDWRRRGDLVVWCLKGGKGRETGEGRPVRVA